MTTDITELAQSLKAAAENATPGEWCSDDQYGIVADAGLNGNYYIASCSGPEHRQNKRFIALANPANILALVEALEKSELRLHEVAVACATAEQSLEKAQQENTDGVASMVESYETTISMLRSRIAELESRTVKLPELCVGVIQDGHAVMVPYPAGHWFNKTAILEMLAASGIKVEAE